MHSLAVWNLGVVCALAGPEVDRFVGDWTGNLGEQVIVWQVRSGAAGSLQGFMGPAEAGPVLAMSDLRVEGNALSFDLEGHGRYAGTWADSRVEGRWSGEDGEEVLVMQRHPIGTVSERVLWGHPQTWLDLEQAPSASVATGDLAIVWVDRDGGQGTAVLRSADEFQIPEKVVMEKDGDFYGRSSGDGSHGITLTYSAASRGDVGGWSSILHYGRVVVDEPPGAGETIELDPADFPTVGSASAETDDLADGAYGLKHPLSPGMPLGPGPVMMRKGRAKKRPVAPDPRYGGMRPVGDLTGVTTVADWTAESETDDLLAVVPMETGTACPLATVLVPGTSLDSAANVAGTVVLATSDREDCADLAVPVGALDIDGEGAEWAVLAQADPDAGTTRLRELVWDGEAWLLLPGVTLPVATLSAVNTGDLDGDGVQDLLLDLPADGDRPATRLSLHTRGRSLAPLDATGTDFAAAPSISEDTLAEAIAALDPTVDLDGLDSVRHGLTAADEPWFVVTDDLAGQWILGLCHGGNTALASCGWSRDEAAAYQGRGRRRAKHLRTWESIL